MKNRRGVTKALLGAVYPILNVATLTNVATGGLHHGQAPQKTLLPYAVLQAPGSAPDLQTMGNPGERVRFQVRAVSNKPDYAEALQIVELAIQLLDGEQPTIANHQVVRLWWESTVTYPDPEMVNGIPVFNAVSQWCALVDQTS
jgi:hypothetical protein